jgi:ParB/RepB/Spo0J family partition protein
MTTTITEPRIYGKIKIRTNQLRPNPYQPSGRIDIPEETAAMLGQSILETGIILTPVARPGKAGPGEEPGYEMGDGWLRLAGIRWIERQGHETYRAVSGEVCCSDQIIVNLCELTDQQMADLVMEANLKRKDLNPIEQAELFSRYTKDFGVSQAKLAADHNITQGEVSNTIRLLELPADIQAMVSGGEISQTHARALLRLKSEPDIQKSFAERVTKTHESVDQLNSNITSGIFDRSKPLNPDSYQGPTFDLSECQTCDRSEKLSRPYGSTKEPRCRDPKCWDKKQAAAEKARIEALKEVNSKAKVLTDKNLGYNEYERLNDHNLANLDNPTECLSCEKRAMFKGHGYDAELVCVDLKCWRNKKAEKTAAANAEAKAAETALNTEIQQLIKNPQFACLVVDVMAVYLFGQLSSKDHVKLASHLAGFDLPEKGDFSGFINLIMQDEDDKRIEELAAAMMFALVRGPYGSPNSWVLRRLMAAGKGELESWVENMTALKANNCPGCTQAYATKADPTELNCGWAGPDSFQDGICQKRQYREPKGISQEIIAEAAA